MFDRLLHDHNPWWTNPGARAAPRQVTRRAMQGAVLRQVLRVEDRRAAVLVGPRQVGKTVLLKQCVDDLLEQGWPPGNITYFDYSDDRLIAAARSPRDVVERRPANCVAGHPRAFFLDEIGRAQGWADWLKQAVDQALHRVVVTDSAATLLRDGSRESGFGRFDQFDIEGLTYDEFLRFQGRADETPAQVEQRLPRPLEAFLFGGGFPEHVGNDSLDEIRRRLRADIADRAILRDLLDLGVDLARVRDLFVYLMEDSGAIFDGASRSKALVRSGNDQPDKRSMEKWLEVLLQTHLICRVDPFGHLATGRLGGRAKPKLYAVDQGLIVAFAASPSPFTDPRVRGQVTEAAVLRAIRATSPEKITYDRTVAETDFVVDWPGHRTVIEVTANDDPRRKTNSLRETARRVHATHWVVVHSGLEADGAGSVVPLRRFLLAPADYVRKP